jgi:hypothetical protein
MRIMISKPSKVVATGECVSVSCIEAVTLVSIGWLGWVLDVISTSVASCCECRRTVGSSGIQVDGKWSAGVELT